MTKHGLETGRGVRLVCVAAAGLLAWGQTARAGEATILHVFGAGRDGNEAQEAPTIDSKGVLYGTTPFGGANGVGVAYKIVPPGAGQTAWRESVLYDFGGGGGDSASPRSEVSIGKGGVLTGTASSGGANGVGTIFTLAPRGKQAARFAESILWNFRDNNDGAFPEGLPIPGAGGVFYGTTEGGGAANDGTVYSLRVTKGKAVVKVIHAFDGTDGTEPGGELITDKDGNIYGQSLVGGPADLGVIFRLSPAGGGWTYSVLHNFTGGSDGRAPGSRLYIDGQGVLWGRTPAAGRICSAIFLP
jgi:uncharacterized repeat protein (TIGR03803 family)